MGHKNKPARFGKQHDARDIAMRLAHRKLREAVLSRQPEILLMARQALRRLVEARGVS